MTNSEIERHPKIVVLRELDAEAARLSDRIFNYLGYEDDLRNVAESLRESLTKRRFLDCQKLREHVQIWPDITVSAGNTPPMTDANDPTTREATVTSNGVKHFVTTVSKTPFPGAQKVQGTDGLGGVVTCYVGGAPNVRVQREAVAQWRDDVEPLSRFWTNERLSNQSFPKL
jgi:hypothetical protein